MMNSHITVQHNSRVCKVLQRKVESRQTDLGKINGTFWIILKGSKDVASYQGNTAETSTYSNVYGQLVGEPTPEAHCQGNSYLENSINGTLSLFMFLSSSNHSIA